MGEGNTAVLMQLLVGMLDAALVAPAGPRRTPRTRVAVALKIDEAPLVINRGFAQTMALKRSAGLETVACWQTDSQWTDREVRDQLDALFAHRVYFATASTGDARQAAGLLMAAYSDQVRADDVDLPELARPDARLHLPKPPRDLQLGHAAGPPAAVPRRDDPAAASTRSASPTTTPASASAAARPVESFRQPHWDRDRRADSPDDAVDARSRAIAGARRRRCHRGRTAPRGGHVTDPTGERERDDFAELREVLRAEMPTSRCDARAQHAAAAAPRGADRAKRAGEPRTARPRLPRRPAATPRHAVAPTPRPARRPESYTELVAVDEASSRHLAAAHRATRGSSPSRSTSRSSPGWPTCASRSPPRSTAASSPSAPTRPPSAACAA